MWGISFDERIGEENYGKKESIGLFSSWLFFLLLFPGDARCAFNYCSSFECERTRRANYDRYRISIEPTCGRYFILPIHSTLVIGRVKKQIAIVRVFSTNALFS